MLFGDFTPTPKKPTLYGIYVIMSFSVIKTLLILILIQMISSLGFARQPDYCLFEKPLQYTTTYQGEFTFKPKEWTDQNFTNPEYLNFLLEAPTKNFTITHELPTLSAIVLRNSTWTIEDVKERLNKTSEVFLQCGVKISTVDLVYANSPTESSILRLHNRCLNPDEEGIYALAEKTPKMNSPKVFFIEDFIIGPAAYAPHGNWVKNSSLESTMWITKKVETYQTPIDPKFEVVAHELGHILLDSGHVHKNKGPNLMSESQSTLSNTLTKDQCAQIKKSEHLRAL